MATDLGEIIESGQFDGQFRINVESIEQARRLAIQLRSGTLPADIRLVEPGS